MRFVPLIELNRWRARRWLHLTGWHPHFAWWPTKMDGNDWRWLEMVERKLHRVSAAGEDWTFANYRPLQTATDEIPQPHRTDRSER